MPWLSIIPISKCLRTPESLSGDSRKWWQCQYPDMVTLTPVTSGRPTLSSRSPGEPRWPGHETRRCSDHWSRTGQGPWVYQCLVWRGDNKIPLSRGSYKGITITQCRRYVSKKSGQRQNKTYILLNYVISVNEWSWKNICSYIKPLLQNLTYLLQYESIEID